MEGYLTHRNLYFDVSTAAATLVVASLRLHQDVLTPQIYKKLQRVRKNEFWPSINCNGYTV